MADFTVRADHIDVEQIMRQIRARIRDKRGADYTEEEIRELAAVKLEKFLDPRAVRSDLLQHYRRQHQPTPLIMPEEAHPPLYDFTPTTVYVSDRGVAGKILTVIRKILKPFSKLFFHVDTVWDVLSKQAVINAQHTRLFQRAHQRFITRDELDALNFEMFNNLVVELTRLGIEVKNLRMQVESFGTRLDFDERRARALEGVVQYRPGAAVARPPQQSPQQAAGVAAGAGGGAGVGGGAAGADEGDEEDGAPGGEGAAGELSRSARRRRRRRGRRRGGQGGAMGAGPGQGPGGADGEDGESDGEGEHDEAPERSASGDAREARNARQGRPEARWQPRGGSSAGASEGVPEAASAGDWRREQASATGAGEDAQEPAPSADARNNREARESREGREGRQESRWEPRSGSSSGAGEGVPEAASAGDWRRDQASVTDAGEDAHDAAASQQTSEHAWQSRGGSSVASRGEEPQEGAPETSHAADSAPAPADERESSSMPAEARPAPAAEPGEPQRVFHRVFDRPRDEQADHDHSASEQHEPSSPAHDRSDRSDDREPSQS